MVPEARRDAILRIVKESLGTKEEHHDMSSLVTQSTSEDSDPAVKHIQNRLSATSATQPLDIWNRPSVFAVVPRSPAADLRHPDHQNTSTKGGWENAQSVTVTSFRRQRIEASLEPRREREQLRITYAHPRALSPVTVSPGQAPKVDGTSQGKTLSRKEILDRIGCHPKDGIEDAVCNGDHAAFANLLNNKKDFWRSKFRKRVRPERVTALHFAALFGKIDMAQRLLDSNFNINEVPHGYTASLTPLKFAIGARQVGMVEFLVANGARPSEPDSWSTLAGQLMNRSWLRKTMSEAEKDLVPNRMIAILEILLKHGWDLNVPFETSGATVLHQAVTFWTGSYTWDLCLRSSVASFLCRRGADPFRADAEGKTPYDTALASGHQDLLLVLSQDSKTRERGEWLSNPVELST
ncbi:ankyrin repeat-containing domain protein [Exophiala viscosa]|uniref:ankyrin repeat-containing domain protein n=1 Tax=Exophiala viscosa TaxID=2486360 RepID=UPI002193FA09|nr:ankyrin repeat-containing domain protein [Exophiala viscosa]